jgi:hypothetical protein
MRLSTVTPSLINIEDLAHRSPTQMIFGLRAPLVDRTGSNAYYFVVTNVGDFMPTNGGWLGPPQGLSGPYQMNLSGLGIRSIKWCAHGLTNASGEEVPRYLILAGTANGGPLQREQVRQRFSLYRWTGNPADSPRKVLADLSPYATRPEGVDLVPLAGGWRLLLVEDRFLSTGYGTRNAIHWPVDILGVVEHNQVVGWGYAYNSDGLAVSHAFIWNEAEGMLDLNSLVDTNSGLVLFQAMDINDLGQITGSASQEGRQIAFRLDPLPRLTIELAGTNAVISWTAIGAGWVLETKDASGAASWQAVPGATNSPVVLPALGSGRLFQLAQYPAFEPRLKIDRSGTNLVISWAPPWPDYVLERTTALSPPSGSAISGATNRPVTLPATGSALFFRLRK